MKVPVVTLDPGFCIPATLTLIEGGETVKGNPFLIVTILVAEIVQVGVVATLCTPVHETRPFVSV